MCFVVWLHDKRNCEWKERENWYPVGHSYMLCIAIIHLKAKNAECERFFSDKNSSTLTRTLGRNLCWQSKRRILWTKRSYDKQKKKIRYGCKKKKKINDLFVRFVFKTNILSLFHFLYVFLSLLILTFAFFKYMYIYML